MLIISDLLAISNQISIKMPIGLQLLYQLHNNRYYRNLYYHRIGPIWSALIGWYRLGDKYFTIGKAAKIGKGFWFAHPYSTILAADKIGDNFQCLHCTTLGNTEKVDQQLAIMLH